MITLAKKIRLKLILTTWSTFDEICSMKPSTESKCDDRVSSECYTGANSASVTVIAMCSRLSKSRGSMICIKADVTAIVPDKLSFLHFGNRRPIGMTPLNVTSVRSTSVCSLKLKGCIGSLRTGSPCTGLRLTNAFAFCSGVRSI